MEPPGGGAGTKFPRTSPLKNVLDYMVKNFDVDLVNYNIFVTLRGPG